MTPINNFLFGRYVIYDRCYVLRNEIDFETSKEIKNFGILINVPSII
jgi:hypothetical protein